MTLKSLLPIIMDNLPPELLDAAAKKQLGTLAEALHIASGGIIELPISQNTGPVGVGICLTEKEDGFSLLEKPDASFGALSKPKVWAALKQFAQTRSKTANPLRTAVKQSWLEFDIDSKTTRLPAPGFFFKLEEPYNRPLVSVAAKGGLELIQKGLESLGVSVSPLSLDTLARCIEVASASTSVGYIGVMLGRETPGFRMVLAGMPFYNIMGYLKKIDYAPRKGMLPLVDFLIERVGLERLSLHLDIHEGIQPRLGLEVKMDPQLNQPTAWQAFLEQLIHTGMCTPARAGALPAWIRQFQHAEISEKWPEALERKYASLHRSISHVKFSYQPGYFSKDIPPGEFGATLASQAHAGEISTKAYLAYQAVRALPSDLWA